MAARKQLLQRKGPLRFVRHVRTARKGRLLHRSAREQTLGRRHAHGRAVTVCVGQVLDTRPPYADDPSSTIFVAIASYRDVRCNETLASLFDGAAFPDRISVCAQHSLAVQRAACTTRHPTSHTGRSL